MSDKRSSNTKARWGRARSVAEKLGIGVKAAWISLSDLEDNGLVEPIMAGIDDAIDLAKEHISEPRNRDFKAKAQDVKLMLWAFDKIGDIDRIKAAYAKAMVVIQ